MSVVLATPLPVVDKVSPITALLLLLKFLVARGWHFSRVFIFKLS